MIAWIIFGSMLWSTLGCGVHCCLAMDRSPDRTTIYHRCRMLRGQLTMSQALRAKLLDLIYFSVIFGPFGTLIIILSTVHMIIDRAKVISNLDDIQDQLAKKIVGGV